MLSLCSPFTNAHAFAESCLGKPVQVRVEARTFAAESVEVRFTGQDLQEFTDLDGVVQQAHGRNIAEILQAVDHRHPGFRIKDLTVVVQCGDLELQKIVSCSPLNLELISTVVRRLLRQLYAK